MTMSGNLVLKVTGQYPSKFKNLWYCLVPGTDKIFKDGYRWIPGYESLKTQRQENRVFFLNSTQYNILIRLPHQTDFC